jgi:hypothetical protein
MITVILKNTTDTSLTFRGRVVPAQGQKNCSGSTDTLRESTTLTAAIDAGDIVINDGASDLIAARGKAHLYAPLFGEEEHIFPGVACVMVPVGTSAERPTSPMDGMLRYNSDTSSFEVCEGGAWSGITGGGGKVVSSASGTIASITSTTNIPLDDTTPLVTEGAEVASLAITPASATHSVKVEAAFTFGNGDTATDAIACIFRDSTCIASFVMADNKTDENTWTLLTFDSPSTTSATTYSIRVGSPSGSTAWYVNRNEANNTLGGTRVHNQFVLTELKP